MTPQKPPTEPAAHRNRRADALHSEGSSSKKPGRPFHSSSSTISGSAQSPSARPALGTSSKPASTQPAPSASGIPTKPALDRRSGLSQVPAEPQQAGPSQDSVAFHEAKSSSTRVAQTSDPAGHVSHATAVASRRDECAHPELAPTQPPVTHHALPSKPQVFNPPTTESGEMNGRHNKIGGSERRDMHHNRRSTDHYRSDYNDRRSGHNDRYNDRHNGRYNDRYNHRYNHHFDDRYNQRSHDRRNDRYNDHYDGRQADRYADYYAGYYDNRYADHYPAAGMHHQSVHRSNPSEWNREKGDTVAERDLPNESEPKIKVEEDVEYELLPVHDVRPTFQDTAPTDSPRARRAIARQAVKDRSRDPQNDKVKHCSRCANNHHTRNCRAIECHRCHSYHLVSVSCFHAAEQRTERDALKASQALNPADSGTRSAAIPDTLDKKVEGQKSVAAGVTDRSSRLKHCDRCGFDHVGECRTPKCDGCGAIHGPRVNCFEAGRQRALRDTAYGAGESQHPVQELMQTPTQESVQAPTEEPVQALTQKPVHKSHEELEVDETFKSQLHHPNWFPETLKFFHEVDGDEGVYKFLRKFNGGSNIQLPLRTPSFSPVKNPDSVARSIEDSVPPRTNEKGPNRHQAVFGEDSSDWDSDYTSHYDSDDQEGVESAASKALAAKQTKKRKVQDYEEDDEPENDEPAPSKPKKKGSGKEKVVHLKSAASRTKDKSKGKRQDSDDEDHEPNIPHKSRKRRRANDHQAKESDNEISEAPAKPKKRKRRSDVDAKRQESDGEISDAHSKPKKRSRVEKKSKDKAKVKEEADSESEPDTKHKSKSKSKDKKATKKATTTEAESSKKREIKKAKKQR
ncbi:hypothetical protein IWZ00DRAFT_258452 [Phyllosticta capitalensis]